MSTFQLTDAINPNKVFMLSKNEIEKRNDPFYYIPSIAELEKKVRQHNPKPLRDFVLSVASGATPKTSEADKYYSDEENGIPFLRVQNLSPTGLLDLDNVKYINKETHEGMLKRSQVSGGDLLIKITGVGRMAVAAVAPEGFVGNTNQHMVVVKTASREVSEILAAYLNTDIAEALASRRATGGTRPALDYPALLSIPIIYDETILEIRSRAIRIKEEKELEAKQLTNSIDNYFLNSLGIIMPKKENNLNNRIYRISSNKIFGNRIDPEYYSQFYQELDDLIKSRKDLKKLKNITNLIDYGLMPTQDYAKSKKEGLPFIRVTNILQSGYINMEKIKYIPFDTPRINDKKVLANDILMVQCGSTTGKVAIVPNELEGYLANSFSFIIRSNNEVNQEYLFYALMEGVK